MSSDSGALSIDFLAGFTIFLIAFVWVISLLPGLLIGLQGYHVDYDAVAYRTGVILAEDPGATTAMNITTPWESVVPAQVARFGLAASRESPNILSEGKVDRFFDTTTFSAEDYRSKAIFGDYPYTFNISLRDIDRNLKRSVGDVLPEGYGYIRRLVKIRTPSNATINKKSIQDYYYNTTNLNSTSHRFTILVNTPGLYEDVMDPSYQINPVQDRMMINITDLQSTMTDPEGTIVQLTSVKENEVSRPGANVSIDGGSYVSVSTLPASVTDNVSIQLSPAVFQNMYEGIYDPALYGPVFVNLTFDLSKNGTYLNNTWSAKTAPFAYNYDTHNVTQPQLRDGLLEVAVW